MIDWESAFKKHLEETREIEKAREKKIEEKEKKEKSWQLLRECLAFLKEKDKSWKVEADERLTERKRKEALNRRNQLKERREKEEELQQKIMATWTKLPEHEQRNLIKQEEKRRHIEKSKKSGSRN